MLLVELGRVTLRLLAVVVWLRSWLSLRIDLGLILVRLGVLGILRRHRRGVVGVQHGRLLVSHLEVGVARRPRVSLAPVVHAEDVAVEDQGGNEVEPGERGVSMAMRTVA